MVRRDNEAPGSEEETPHEVAERYPKPRSETQDSSRELGIFAAVVMTFLAAALLLIVRLLKIDGPQPGPLATVQCKAGDPSSCPSGMVCAGVECVPIRRTKCEGEAACGAGQCECPEGTMCREDKCAVLQGNLCDDPGVRSLLKTVAQHCKAGQSCSVADVKAMMLNDDAAAELFTRFPRALALSFDIGLPPVQGGGRFWYIDKARAPYRQFLERYRDWLDEAKIIFVIGTASQTGAADHDVLYGVERMNAAQQWIRDVYSARPPEEATAAEKKIRVFTIGDHRSTDITSFNKKFKDRFSAWSEEATRRLETNLKATTLVQGEALWTVQTANQLAIVLPIPCELGNSAP